MSDARRLLALFDTPGRQCTPLCWVTLAVWRCYCRLESKGPGEAGETAGSAPPVMPLAALWWVEGPEAKAKKDLTSLDAVRFLRRQEGPSAQVRSGEAPQDPASADRTRTVTLFRSPRLTTSTTATRHSTVTDTPVYRSS